MPSRWCIEIEEPGASVTEAKKLSKLAGVIARDTMPRNWPFGPETLQAIDGGPAALEAARHQLDPEAFEFRSGLERLEVVAVADADVANGPVFRGIDQHAVGIEDVDAGDVGVGAQPQLQHVVPFRRRHHGAERFRRGDAGTLDLRDHVALDSHEILELLVEMPGHQQHVVFELPFGAGKRAFAEIAGHDGGAERDRGNQEKAADRQASGSDLPERISSRRWGRWRSASWTGIVVAAKGRGTLSNP